MLRDSEVEQALDRIIERGRPRLHRTWPELLSTGAVAGTEVALGVLALLAVPQATDSPLQSRLGVLGGLHCFASRSQRAVTEGFLVPVTVVAAGQTSWWQLLRLSIGTLASNLAGGWVATWLVVVIVPEPTGVGGALGGYFTTAALSLHPFYRAALAGSTITLAAPAGS